MGCGDSKAVSTVQIQPRKSFVVSRNQFESERLIGQGGFGRVDAVYKTSGYDKGSRYAMKTLTKAVVLERNHVGMVFKERNLLARLHCPQLVNMHYAFQDDRNLYIVMDLCLGGDLHYQLSQQPQRCFSEEQTRLYVAEIILALEYMHAAKVLHRDIKPENLLLDEKGFLKVTDLGVSSEVDSAGICAATSGTRPYMAPEVFMAGHQHSYVSDFYSVGVTAFQLLTGQRPYKPDTANLKAIVRMSTFIPPEKYTDLRQIRRILVNAQERKAPSPEFRYSATLMRFSPEAREFIQLLLICNPKYRLGSEGTQELRSHPWFNGLDWDALASHNSETLFVPDVSQANCSVGTTEAAALALADEATAAAPAIPDSEQAKFRGYDYRVSAVDKSSGRTERVPYSPPSMSHGPDSMRHSTVTYAQHTEVLSHASVANYGANGSLIYRAGDSAIFGSAARSEAGGGHQQSKQDGALFSASSASRRPLGLSINPSHRNGGSGLYSPLSPGATLSPKVPPVTPAEVPPGSVLSRRMSGPHRDSGIVIAVAPAPVAPGSPDSHAGVTLGGRGVASPDSVLSPMQPEALLSSGLPIKSVMRSNRLSASQRPGSSHGSPRGGASPRIVNVAPAVPKASGAYAVSDHDRDRERHPSEMQ